MFATPCLLILGLFGQSQEIDDAVAAHESAVSQIRKFDIVVVARNVQQNGKRMQPPVELCRVRWSWDGSRDRTQIEYSPATDSPAVNLNNPRHRPSSAARRLDVFTDGTFDYRLRGWDPKSGKITSANSRGVTGTLVDAVPGNYNTAYAIGSMFTLTKVAACSLDQQRSLKEFAHDSPQVRCQTVDLHGARTRKLIMQHPDTASRGKFRDVVISATMDPQSFMIAELEVQLPASALGAESRQVHRVHKFREFGGGIMLPEKVTATSYFKGGDNVNEFELITEKTTMNGQLPSDALDFRFPEGLLVRDLSTLHGGKVLVHVWGADNRPARTIEDLSELGPPPSDVPAQDAKRRWRTYLIYGAGAPILLALVALLIWRRRS